MPDTRKCLKCREEFTPQHSYNFLCPKCNHQNKTVREGTLEEGRSRRVVRKEIGDT